MDPELSQGASTGAMIGGMVVYLVIILAVTLGTFAGLWKVFEKAGQPGWAAIVPVYNILVLLQIVGKPAWWVLLVLCTGGIGWILVGMAVAERFGKSQVFGIVGLGLFSFVGYPMLGFSDATYSAPPAA